MPHQTERKAATLPIVVKINVGIARELSETCIEAYGIVALYRDSLRTTGPEDRGAARVAKRLLKLAAWAGRLVDKA